MADLFGCAVANINMHLKNIYADGELEEMATIKDFLIVRFEGNRSVARNVKHYNLDADAGAAGEARGCGELTAILGEI